MDYDFRTYIWTIFGQVIFWLLHQGSYMANIWTLTSGLIHGIWFGLRQFWTMTLDYSIESSR